MLFCPFSEIHRQLRKLAADSKITLQKVRELALGYLYGQSYRCAILQSNLRSLRICSERKFNRLHQGKESKEGKLGMSKQLEGDLFVSILGGAFLVSYKFLNSSCVKFACLRIFLNVPEGISRECIDT